MELSDAVKKYPNVFKKLEELDKTALMSKEARADFKFEQKRKLKITAKRAELEKLKDKMLGMKEFSKEEKLLILEMFGCGLNDYYGNFDGELFCDYLERADKQRKALRKGGK